MVVNFNIWLSWGRMNICSSFVGVDGRYALLSLITLSYQTHIPFLLFYNHCDTSELHVRTIFYCIYKCLGVGVPCGWWIFKEWTNKSCVGRFFNMLRAWVKIALTNAMVRLAVTAWISARFPGYFLRIKIVFYFLLWYNYLNWKFVDSHR